MQVTGVVGLPGSGKTMWARAVPDAWVVDDPTHVSQLPQITQLQDLNVNHVVITDPWFCGMWCRQLAEEKISHTYDVTMQWVFFENDPDACVQNVMRRSDGRKVLQLIRQLSAIYQIPESYKPIPVWRCDHVA